MRKWLCLSLWLWASPVLAQPHPCDVVPPTNPNLSSPVKAQFCYPALPVTAFKVYLDGNPVPVFQGPLTPIGAPNANGLSYYETPPFTVTQGPHAGQVSAVNGAGEGPTSSVYPFAVTVLPVAPSNVRVAQ